MKLFSYKFGQKYNLILFSNNGEKKVIFNIINGSIVNREMTDALISAEFRVFFV